MQCSPERTAVLTGTHRNRQVGEKRALPPSSTIAYTFYLWKKDTVCSDRFCIEAHSGQGKGPDSTGYCEPRPRPPPTWAGPTETLGKTHGSGRPQSPGRCAPEAKTRRDSLPAAKADTLENLLPTWGGGEVSRYPKSTSASGFRHAVSVWGGASGAEESGPGWQLPLPDVWGGVGAGSWAVSWQPPRPRDIGGMSERRGRS